MDRRNGGDPLAPPRPPKLLPRVHRPRAPEPTTMSETVATQTTPARTTIATNTDTTTITATTSTAIPQCTNCNQQSLSRNNNTTQQQQQQQLQQQQQQQQQNHSITTPTTTRANTASLTANNNFSSSHSNSSGISNHFGVSSSNSSSNNNNNNNVAVITTQPEFDDYQIHHLTFLPQRPSSLSRNSSHVSTNSSSSSSITAANSFTRRRPPPPTPGAAVPLLSLTGNSSGGSNSSSTNLNSFLSHFHSNAEPTSPVTLAQPRPESERLTNEYVDTPLRTAQQLQLQHATRIQHPAGQHDNGQTTTHHLLLLPQRELRQQHQQHQQQQQQQQQHSNRLAGTAGTGNATTGTDGTDGFIHSHNNTKLSTTTTAQTARKVTPTPTPARGFATPGIQPITQPITKQPASTQGNSSCKFAKDLPALDELLDLHNIATGISTPQGMVSAVNGASPLGTPIIIGGDPASLNPITCPRCERCRCEQCQSPRPLPQTWVCNKTCLCSAESIIDYASCLCCAKALFYHCARDNDMDCDDGSGTPCVDNPCSCGPYKRTQRWGWLGALSLVLPCLWCYWPMRGCVTLCEKCYGRYAGRGCRCQQIGSTSSMLPIVPLGINSNNIGNGQNANSSTQGNTTKSVNSGSHHHCSTASRILRKGDLTPEKRLLDSSPEY
ncbi:protein sprouty [Teleopsis dalmanni]|uniref:protein sprouty n=1 Tax=Teleopsis dalmanni TaxID=139649 RepID=UPI0018CEAF49|nr:protein sprouty [Teleopsis dalmanni]